MSKYPADLKLLSQHAILDTPESPASIIFFPTIGNPFNHGLSKFLLASLMTILWIAGIYCLLNAAYILYTSLRQSLRTQANYPQYYFGTQSSSYGNNNKNINNISINSISSNFAPFFQPKLFSRRTVTNSFNDNSDNLDNSDLESQRHSFSTTCSVAPSLVHSEVASPVSGYNSPPLSSASKSSFDSASGRSLIAGAEHSILFSQGSLDSMRNLLSSSPSPLSKGKVSNMAIVDPFDPSLLVDTQPMVKIH